VGRVWPRHGHRGRPLNAIVSRHLSDLHDIANRKIAAESDKLIAALPQQLEAAKRSQAPKGLHSGNTAALLRDVCVEPIRALGPHIIEQYKWAASTALFLTQTFATSLAASADAQIAPLFDICAQQLSSQLQALNMANLKQELMPSLEAKQREILIDVRIELDRAFAERRRGAIRNLAIGIGNILGKGAGK
jgi:hypothetical protein